MIIAQDFASTKTILKTGNLAIEFAFIDILLSHSKNLVTAYRLQMYSESFEIFHLVEFSSTQAGLRRSRSIAFHNFKMSWVCFDSRKGHLAQPENK